MRLSKVQSFYHFSQEISSALISRRWSPQILSLCCTNVLYQSREPGSQRSAQRVWQHSTTHDLPLLTPRLLVFQTLFYNPRDPLTCRLIYCFVYYRLIPSQSQIREKSRMHEWRGTRAAADVASLVVSLIFWSFESGGRSAIGR